MDTGIPESLKKYPPHKRHLAHILKWYPDALKGKMLDLGSGAGSFLIQAASAGADIVGVEPSQELIDASLERAQAEGLRLEVQKGTGERLPFRDGSFRFINMAEVIEHVDDPEAVLREAHRVLESGGGAYVSVPNRFGMYDPPVHMHLINWLPRAVAAPLLRIAGTESGEPVHFGRQRLADMHYYTFGAFARLARSIGFRVIDTRQSKLRDMPLSPVRRLLYRIAYRAARPFYFDTFHLGLIKEAE